jgi:hypothetical protein
MEIENTFKLNVILVANVKPETKSTGGKDAYSFEYTGGFVEDVQKGSDRRVDIIGRMYKTKPRDGKIYRAIKFVKSRFEGEVIDANKITILSPTSNKVIDNIVDLYLKTKKSKGGS